MGQQAPPKPQDGPACQLVTRREAAHVRVAERGGHVAHRLQLPLDVGLQAERGAVQEAALQRRREAAEDRGRGSGPLSHPHVALPGAAPQAPLTLYPTH